jgi:hypothetical protein
MGLFIKPGHKVQPGLLTCALVTRALVPAEGGFNGF